jgi:hypothetical protein
MVISDTVTQMVRGWKSVESVAPSIVTKRGGKGGERKAKGACVLGSVRL